MPNQVYLPLGGVFQPCCHGHVALDQFGASAGSPCDFPIVCAISWSKSIPGVGIGTSVHYLARSLHAWVRPVSSSGAGCSSSQLFLEQVVWRCRQRSGGVRGELSPCCLHGLCWGESTNNCMDLGREKLLGRCTISEGAALSSASCRALSPLASGSSSALCHCTVEHQADAHVKPPGLYSSPRLCDGDFNRPLLATGWHIFLTEQMNCWDAQSPCQPHQAALVNAGDGVGDPEGLSHAASHWAASLHRPPGH